MLSPKKKGAANIYIERLEDVKEGCKMTGVSRSKYYYKPKKDSHSDSILLDKIKDIATEYPYYGYRRIAASLRRHGHPINPKKVYRIMRGNGICCSIRRCYKHTTGRVGNWRATELYQPVSSSRLIKRSMRISRTALSC